MARSVTNALGQQLYYSDTSTGFFSATGSGPDLYGTARNDSMWGDSSVNVTMRGGTGDDIYYLYSTINRAAEARNEGIDTINTWMSYTLPENFENLVVTGDGRHAFGNSADNIITGGSGKQTIDGGAGNDVLIGAGGADTFVFSKGSGSDLITDFSSDDKVRLDGFGVTSFEHLLSLSAQKGNELWFNFSNGDSLVLADTKASDLHADQFRLSLDRSRLTSTFSEEFNSLSLSDGKSGVWEPKFWWAGEQGGSLHTNSEKQWYINPEYQPTSSVNPFSVHDGVLTIRAAPTPDALSNAVNGYDYTSGMLTTHPSFSQTYGYFEIRADMPNEQGAWPAFWLLPHDGKWPPELDVIEMRGQNPNTLIMSAHSAADGKTTSTINNISVPSTDGFHRYGLLWEKEHITWYFDDVAVAQIDTPADMHDRMYMLVNLAVGGMAGTPANGLPNGSEMKVDYIHAYTLNDPAIPATQHTTQHPDLLT